MRLIDDWRILHKKYSVIATGLNIGVSLFQLTLDAVFQRQISLRWYIAITLLLGMASIIGRAISQGPDDGKP